jgi:glycosyltransferase involved in cell wall biosynthesis
MRRLTIVVGATQVPFERGGAEWHAAALRDQLAARGHTVELVQVPFQWDPREAALRSALAWRLLDFTRAGGVPIDLYIGTRFPSYVARHPAKVVWLFHQFRQAYDLHEAGVDGFPDTPEGRALRRHVIELDTQALRECRAVYTTSRNNAARLRRFNGLEARVLRLPLVDPSAFRAEAYEPFVLSVGRLVSLKRVDLLLRALAHVPPPASAVIVGEGPERAVLEALVAELGVAARVRFAGYVTDADTRALYARAGAVFYAPWDEDYGLVTLEAFHARKPVVTTTDAGGPLEFVEHERTGLVAAPEPESVGAALARLLRDPDLARELGEAGRAAIAGYSWDQVAAELTRWS